MQSIYHFQMWIQNHQFPGTRLLRRTAQYGLQTPYQQTVKASSKQGTYSDYLHYFRQISEMKMNKKNLNYKVNREYVGPRFTCVETQLCLV